MNYRRSLVWLRRDLRLSDSPALFEACRASDAIVPVFVLDPALLRGPVMGAPIVQAFFSALAELRETLHKHGGDLVILEGDFARELCALAKTLEIDALYYHRDTDPAAAARDAQVTAALQKASVDVHALDELCYFPPGRIRQDSGKHYTVFTPFKKRWLAAADQQPADPVGSERLVAKHLLPRDLLPPSRPLPAPEQYGHTGSKNFPAAGEKRAKSLLAAFLKNPVDAYGDTRNFPALAGTSHLSPQLRAGTIGIRTCIHLAMIHREETTASKIRANIDIWISELVWRDFYHQILAHFPHVASEPFDERAKHIRWQNSEHDFAAWAEGRTGYPIVDAAMRQLHTYGWMHNRLRMIVASFLTKDLLVDYRWGERHFEHWLADADLAANNGGWQWSASTGTDAAPYFRVFNPVTQSKNFDPDGAFIRRMLPELAGLHGDSVHAPWTAPPLLLREANIELGKHYPLPVVDHAAARERALDAFGAVFGKNAAKNSAR